MGNRSLKQLGYNPIDETVNPVPWLDEQVNIKKEKNFFETKVTELPGRQPSNISRTLKTLEGYGIVETKKTSRTKRPIVKALDFDIQLST